MAVAGTMALVVAMPAAFADDRVCRGTIGARTVDGNVIVPQSATCNLNGTRVKGNVLVRSNARLYAKTVRVDGNIQSQGFRVVSVVQRSFVDGDIQLKNGRSGGTGNIRATTIEGNLQLEQNLARLVAGANVIDGDLQAFKNRGGLSINNNRMDGNLQCKQNNPAPTGSGNRADSKEGQCSRL